MSAPALLGCGYAVPDTIRRNDDPIFDWLHAHEQPGQNLFQGYDERRVLAEGESLIDIMLPAAQSALAAAGRTAADIDLLLGTGSVSPWDPPNALCELHHRLALPAHCWTLPLANDFTNFNAGLWLADALICSGQIRHALICIGTNWTRHVSYHTPQAISAADGAGAAIVGTADAGWRLLGQQTITDSAYYGAMAMKAEAVTLNPPVDGHDRLYTRTDFQIDQRGIDGFRQFGVDTAPQAVRQLLQRHGLGGSDISLIAHQASSVLLQAWQRAIEPAQLLQTLASYANMTAANIPVNLAWGQAEIQSDHLVLFGLGPEMHANALLLRRG